MKNLKENPTQNDITKLSELRDIVEKVSIRRLKNNVLQLPEKSYKNVYVILSGRQKELYENLRKNS